MAVKDMTVRYGGTNDTGKGAVLLKFIAPASEMALYTRLALFTQKQVFVYAKWTSQDKAGNLIERDEQLGVFQYAGKSEDPGGECTMKFRGDVNSVLDEPLAQLKRDCVSGVTGEGQMFLLDVLELSDIDVQTAATTVAVNP